MEYSFYDQEIIKQFITSAFHISWIWLWSIELRRGKGMSVYGLHWFFTSFLSCLCPVTYWGNHGRWMLSGSVRKSTSQRLGQLRLGRCTQGWRKGLEHTIPLNWLSGGEGSCESFKSRGCKLLPVGQLDQNHHRGQWAWDNFFLYFIYLFF